MVDIIHTDAGLYGQPISTGSVDFWPNGGNTLQPGCPFRLGIPLNPNGNITSFENNIFSRIRNYYYYDKNTDLCSHQRSVKYFAESVSSPKYSSFQTVSAKNWTAFKVNNTNSTNVVNMGIDCPSRWTKDIEKLHSHIVDLHGLPFPIIVVVFVNYFSAHGDYYLQTNGEPSFSRGPNGLRYLNWTFSFHQKQ